ncbi:SapC family protein [Sphingobium sp. B11D3A]|uniref:SapC family protein n=1 Tax=Sphingobium sp. B11D3A TaxID=2940574 RepID=UPI00222460B6|nr:SapC family protein [Sphingobium sp. B11D3A]MCW2393541.1 hypothetical protein [Sphingobium sp. B11D3A]
MTNAQNNIELTGSQLLYDRPEALNSAVHADLRYDNTLHDFGNAQSLHLVPLLVGEFPQAMLHYPIVFAGAERTPLAVMGLQQGQNLFVKDGQFEPNVYIPAYLRRYPFTLAQGEGDQLVVCIDRAAKGFVTSDKDNGDGARGGALFEDGEQTAFTKNAVRFLEEFEAERRSTQEFINTVEACGLFEVKNTIFQTGERREHLADYFGVSEEKLRELQNYKIADLVKRGATAMIDMHLVSLRRWDDLIARRARRKAEATPEAAAA